MLALLLYWAPMNVCLCWKEAKRYPSPVACQVFVQVCLKPFLYSLLGFLLGRDAAIPSSCQSSYQDGVLLV